MKKQGLLIGFFVVLAGLIFAAAAPIPEIAPSGEISSGNTGFVLLCTALVLLMTPGLALFYGGMVRTKNVLSTLMQSLTAIAIVSVQWVLFGYTLAFGPDMGHLLGNFSWLGLSGVGFNPNPDYSASIPHLAFVAFQGMFAVITPALISGSFAERVRFPAFVAFILIWTTFIYDPVAHWVWGVGGWMRQAGVLDFAGGTVVHILSGVSGLVAALYVGKRKGFGTEAMLPHHLPMTVLGAGLLWFGWFGFNAGSALEANGIAAVAFVATNVAAAAATISWVGAEWIHRGKPTVLGAASGAVAGLVAITPACGFVSPVSAIAIGLMAGGICYFAVAVIKNTFGYDDALDAFGVHGIGGTFGAIATGIFASKGVNPAGADGLLYGNTHTFLMQLMGVGVSWVVAALGTYLILRFLNMFMAVRAEEEEERVGMDIADHGERGYAYQDFMGAATLRSENHPFLVTAESVPAFIKNPMVE